jgi:hypothetical protein
MFDPRIVEPIHHLPSRRSAKKNTAAKMAAVS